MDVTNITTGMVIKNYPSFCKLVKEQECAGNSKIAQLKEWQRYLNFHKEGNKFVIDDIYEYPLPRKDNRGGNYSVYSDYIKILVKSLLYHFRNSTLSFSINQFLTNLPRILPSSIGGRWIGKNTTWHNCKNVLLF